VSQETTNRSFDELARALAEGSISRRRALRLFAGTAIAALIPSTRAMADDDCVKICHIPFERTSTGVVCHRKEADTRCVSRERVRFHLANHPCDCRGSCASTNKCRGATSSTTSTSTSTSTTTSMCLPIQSPCDIDAGFSHCCSPAVCYGESGVTSTCCIPADGATTGCTTRSDCCDSENGAVCTSTGVCTFL